MNFVKRRLLRVAYLLVMLWRIVWRPTTLGVRVLLIRDAEVLLVRHTYRGGWFLPGGGLKRGETLEEAARREAREEVGAAITDLRLTGAYSNFVEARGDHVVFFASESFELTPCDSAEIGESRFFPLAELPEDISPGSLQPIQEYRRTGLPSAPLG